MDVDMLAGLYVQMAGAGCGRGVGFGFGAGFEGRSGTGRRRAAGFGFAGSRFGGFVLRVDGGGEANRL